MESIEGSEAHQFFLFGPDKHQWYECVRRLPAEYLFGKPFLHPGKWLFFSSFSVNRYLPADIAYCIFAFLQFSLPVWLFLTTFFGKGGMIKRMRLPSFEILNPRFAAWRECSISLIIFFSQDWSPKSGVLSRNIGNLRDRAGISIIIDHRIQHRRTHPSGMDATQFTFQIFQGRIHFTPGLGFNFFCVFCRHLFLQLIRVPTVSPQLLFWWNPWHSGQGPELGFCCHGKSYRRCIHHFQVSAQYFVITQMTESLCIRVNHRISIVTHRSWLQQWPLCSTWSPSEPRYQSKCLYLRQNHNAFFFRCRPLVA